MRLTETIATCSADVIRWIVENEHHHGYWTGSPESRAEFCLEGKTKRLRIPARVHKPGLIQGADFKATGRMYEPTASGRAALAQSEDASRKRGE